MTMGIACGFTIPIILSLCMTDSLLPSCIEQVLLGTLISRLRLLASFHAPSPLPLIIRSHTMLTHVARCLSTAVTSAPLAILDVGASPVLRRPSLSLAEHYRTCRSSDSLMRRSHDDATHLRLGNRPDLLTYADHKIGFTTRGLSP